jgi:tetratricopeptide (TPR) repeat protein
MFRAFAVLPIALAAALVAMPAQAQWLDYQHTKLMTNPSDADTLFPSDPQGAIDAARQRIAAGDLRGAINGLRVYVVSHPQDVAPIRFLGDLYYRAGEFGRAEFLYQQLLAANPHDKESHNRLGVVYATENRVDDAIAQFNAALPGTDSVSDLVAMHTRKGDLPAYEAQMERLALEYPADPAIQAELGQVYQALHRDGDAMPYYMRALDSDPQSLTALDGLGLAYLEVGDYDSAASYFQRCLAVDPLNYSCNDNLAANDLEAGKFDEARPILDKTYRLSPERPEALVNYGYLFDAGGDWKKAVAYYVKAIAVGPYRPEAYINLGIDYENNALYPLAQSALLKGVAAVPDDGRIRFLLGRVYAKQGLTTLAIAQFAAAEKSYDQGIVHISQLESAKLLPAALPTAQ